MKRIVFIFSLLVVAVSLNSLAAQTISIAGVPSDVMDRFNESLIYGDEGEVRGAYVDEIKAYVTIQDVVEALGNGGTDPYGDYKPKGKRGCKRKLGWICFAPSDDPFLD